MPRGGGGGGGGEEGDNQRRRKRRPKNKNKSNNNGAIVTTTNSTTVSTNDISETAPPITDHPSYSNLYAGINNTADNPNNPNANDFNQSLASTAFTDDDTFADRELAELQLLCDAASESDPTSWDKIRRWLRNHGADDARAAAERRGDYDTTPLHLACRNCPPLDIVNMLLTASPRTVELADSFGWLPLHYACANEASEEVLVMLAEQYPTSKTSVDKRKRTPLHFALGHTDRPANVATVVLLSGTGAALMADENGMLPLHYACAYGATEQALRVLTDENIQTITATDNRGRTPLHFALGNADRPASPGVVGLLLSQNPAVVNSIDLEGNLPIHLLATRAQAIKADEKEKCMNCQECFGLYLESHPRATADLLTALQSLPDWLREPAVLSPVVQKILNIKISQRIPMMVTLADLIFYVLVIVFFQLSVKASIEYRDAKMDPDVTEGMITPWVIGLYIAVIYFSAREIIQAFSLASLGLFSTWLRDSANWLDLSYIVIILFWAIVMSVDGRPYNLDTFRGLAALSMALFWYLILNFLRSIYIGFAVFVGGLAHVLKRLGAFLVVLVIILIMFSQIFWTLFQKSPECDKYVTYDLVELTTFPIMEFSCTGNGNTTVDNGMDTTTYNDCTQHVTSCEPTVEHPFCNKWTSFLKIFTMLLGEVEETDFENNKLAEVSFVAFMFTVVIVLANVLIAIVTDSYSVIQNERAALVFWSNRLDFVAEMDVISNSFSRKGRGEARGVFEADDGAIGELWKKLMYLFDDDTEDHGVMSVEFIIYTILRIFAACVIPLWLVIGFFSLGLLWPPQVREKILTSKMTDRTEKSNAERHRLDQVNTLKEDVTFFKEELKTDMEKGRDELYIIKAVLDTTKTEIHMEMDEVKEIVTDLFELLGST